MGTIRVVTAVSFVALVAACSSSSQGEVSSSTEQPLATTESDAGVAPAPVPAVCPVALAPGATPTVVTLAAPTAFFESSLGYGGSYADAAYFGRDGSAVVVVAMKAGAPSFAARLDLAADASSSTVAITSKGQTTASYQVSANGTLTGNGDLEPLFELGRATEAANGCGGDFVDTDCVKLLAKLFWERVSVIHTCLNPLEWILCAAEVAALAHTEREWKEKCNWKTGSCAICLGQPGGHGGLCKNNCAACASSTGVSVQCLTNICENGWNGVWPPKCDGIATSTSLQTSVSVF